LYRKKIQDFPGAWEPWNNSQLFEYLVLIVHSQVELVVCYIQYITRHFRDEPFQASNWRCTTNKHNTSFQRRAFPGIKLTLHN